MEYEQYYTEPWLTSIQVFNYFIKWSSSKELLIEENVLSRDCYDLWLRTRKTKLKHPADSFRRTLLAHLRGSDGRGAFDSRVEASILQKLRTISASGQNPFNFLSKNQRKYRPSWKNSLSKAYGYHERQKRATPLGIDTNTEELAKWVGLSQQDFIEKATLARKHDVNFFTPGLSYLISVVSSSDSRLSPSFVLPSPSECFFRSDLEVYHQTSSVQNWRLTWGDQASTAVFGDTIGLHISAGFNSTFEFLNTMRLMLPEFESKGEVWFRVRGRLLEGNKRPCLTMFQRKISPTTTEGFYQFDMEYFDETEACSPPMLI